MAKIWTFKWTSNDQMSQLDLEAYQKKLKQIRKNFENKLLQFPECQFYSHELQLPPKDNIFAKFEYECHRHKRLEGN